jgi:hypothetical protein
LLGVARTTRPPPCRSQLARLLRSQDELLAMAALNFQPHQIGHPRAAGVAHLAGLPSRAVSADACSHHSGGIVSGPHSRMSRSTRYVGSAAFVALDSEH